MKCRNLLSFGILAIQASGQVANYCKAFPGDQNWPSDETWQKLNKTLGGVLIKSVPLAVACLDEHGTHDDAACDAIKQRLWNYDFHDADPVSVMWNQYSNFSCLPNPATPCSSRGYPAYVVDASTVKHVQHAVNFARNNNIRLVVKSTGHDYLGRSTAPGALSIWVHHLNTMTYHANEFRLHGSDKVIPGSAITVGGGSQMNDIYLETAKYGQTVVGGGSKSVGVAGYITGGGHSVLSPRYGLAADNVLEIQLVDPNGHVITVNEEQRPRLFWALRGGGGSTFGVITSITLKALPSPKVTSVVWRVNVNPAELSILPNLASYLMSQVPYLMDSGLSGYTMIGEDWTTPILIDGRPEKLSGVMGLCILQDQKDLNYAYELFRPINDTVQERWLGKASVTIDLKEYDSFYAWFNDNYDQGKAGFPLYPASRLLDQKSLTENAQALSEALSSMWKPRKGMLAFLVGGQGVNNAQPQGGSNSVHPAWRSAHVHALTGTSFPPSDEAAKMKAIATVNSAMERLRNLTPTSGAYVNEAFKFESDWQQAFWGSNYKRLLRAKRSLDPNDVFWCDPCVGNEGWTELPNGKLCRSGE
ncbi:FAD-binding, type 2, partial [Metarhizium hybridum]